MCDIMNCFVLGMLQRWNFKLEEEEKAAMEGRARKLSIDAEMTDITHHHGHRPRTRFPSIGEHHHLTETQSHEHGHENQDAQACVHLLSCE